VRLRKGSVFPATGTSYFVGSGEPFSRIKQKRRPKAPCADYREESTLFIGNEFAMTTALDILRANGSGQGPRRCLVALG
jgi:hypothetical protein